MENREQILENLKRFFIEDVFNVTYDETHGEFVVYRNMDVKEKGTKNIINKDITCIKFALDHTKKQLVIKLILSCSIDLQYLGRGKDIVERIVAFSKNIEYIPIIEYDVSIISVHDVEIPLRKLKLLSSGKTWYNSLGFYEDEYDINQQCIEKFIKKIISKKPRDAEGNTISEIFTDIMRKMNNMARKESLTKEEYANLNTWKSAINRKFRDMENACTKLFHNFSDLKYKGDSKIGIAKEKTEIPTSDINLLQVSKILSSKPYSKRKTQKRKLSPSPTKKNKTKSVYKKNSK